uniref:RNA polymerase II subunit A C-terminal domain phosphatase n=5 Tax=Pararge aegeria TaxID=116150 RepID=S4NHB6_9NEOP
MDSLNPLLSFSSDDIADMDREVEDIFNESDESSSDDEEKPTDDVDDEENISEDRLLSLETSQSSQDRLGENKEGNDSSDSNTEDGERPRKRPRPSTPPSDDDVPPDDDDSSWNLMGAALEREFLAQD